MKICALCRINDGGLVQPYLYYDEQGRPQHEWLHQEPCSRVWHQQKTLAPPVAA